MKYQRFVSLAAALTFVFVFLSSGVLYFIPDRGVTGWTGWHFLGLDKQQWDNLHINLGILFLVLIVWHIYFNWKPIKHYLKVKKEWKVFTKEFNAALVLVVLFVAGTITMTFPLSFLVNIGNGIKAVNSLSDANPPFAYAEYATLEDFAILTHIDPQTAQKRLKAKGYRDVSLRKTLREIARRNGTSPRELFLTLRDRTTQYLLPSALPVGMARKSLQRLEEEYVIDLEAFIRHLKHYGITATRTMTFKRLAKTNGLHPAELYNMLIASQVKAQQP
jgi:hypothetical protein